MRRLTGLFKFFGASDLRFEAGGLAIGFVAVVSRFGSSRRRIARVGRCEVWQREPCTEGTEPSELREMGSLGNALVPKPPDTLAGLL